MIKLFSHTPCLGSEKTIKPLGGNKMEPISFITICILILLFLAVIFRKFFLVPLFLGIGGLIWGLALLLDSLDNLNGLKNQITNFLNDEKYQDYLLHL